MKTLDTLAAIGCMTLVFVACKMAMAVNEVVNGPTKRKLEKIRKEKKAS